MSHWSGLSLDLCVTACLGRSITLIQPQVCVCTNQPTTFLQPGSLQTLRRNADTESYSLGGFFSRPHKIKRTNAAPWLGEPQGLGLMTNKLSVCTNISAPQMKYRFSRHPKSWWVLGEGMFVCIWVWAILFFLFVLYGPQKNQTHG